MKSRTCLRDVMVSQVSMKQTPAPAGHCCRKLARRASTAHIGYWRAQGGFRYTVRVSSVDAKTFVPTQAMKRPSLGAKLCRTWNNAITNVASTLLGLDPETGYSAAALFFDNEQRAQIVAGAFEPFTVGYGHVEVGCND